jgi:hypothetical protein
MFLQGHNTHEKYGISTLIIENNTKATITIYIDRYGIPYERAREDIPPMKTISLKNLLFMGRNVITAAARKAPMKTFQNASGNIATEYYTAKEVFWVSGEGTKAHKWILTSDLFGAVDLEDEATINIGDTENIIDLTGTWKSQKGVYKVVQTKNKIKWFGSGKFNDNYWEHNATGKVTGKTIKANYRDTEKSFWKGNSGNINGTISEDGNSIDWSGLNKYETHWERKHLK